MRFKVVVMYKTHEITHVFQAEHLEELEEMIMKKFPNSKIISIIGGNPA